MWNRGYRQPYPNELWHHGVLGMKWGVRNGPPYPLYEGHGNSKAVLESKAKYGPSNVFDDIRKKKERLLSTAFENTMAKKARDASRRQNNLSKMASKVKEGKTKDWLNKQAEKAKEEVDKINALGVKYSALSTTEQKKISAGYLRTGIIMSNVLKNTARSNGWSAYGDTRRRRKSWRSAEKDAINKIEKR